MVKNQQNQKSIHGKTIILPPEGKTCKGKETGHFKKRKPLIISEYTKDQFFY